MTKDDKKAPTKKRPRTRAVSTVAPGPPLSESVEAMVFAPIPSTESSELVSAAWPSGTPSEATPVAIAPGEALQLVHYERRGDTLFISGITPHGRRLVFEQREDRQGWYVVTAGRRRRPTERELGLVVATITQEMEAALIPERQAEVRSAYRLAAASDQPGMEVKGLEAYRDILLDEARTFVEGENERLAVVAINYQAFKRFAIRHGHRIGAAFIRALGERLWRNYRDELGVQVFHKTGKSFRLIVVNRPTAEVRELAEMIATPETRRWIVERVWGSEGRTHPDEIHFNVGIAAAYPSERDADSRAFAQRLSDDAYRASRLGQLLGHTSIVLAKSDYRSTLHVWGPGSEERLHELATEMDDGPGEVMAEMSDYLHELSPADLEGMAVAGDLGALVFCAIARDGFWQGTTAMRIAGDRILRSFISESESPDRPRDKRFVGGFDLGDEFYGIAVDDGRLYFARGDVNFAGVTRVRAGLARLQDAVGWRRTDGGGMVGEFIRALDADGVGSLPERVRQAAKKSYQQFFEDPDLRVNDNVDIADHLFFEDGTEVSSEAVVEGAELRLVLPERPALPVTVLERRSGFTLRLELDGVEHRAVIHDAQGRLQVKLRVRDAVPSLAVSIISVSKKELLSLLREVREDNEVRESTQLDVIEFLRHIGDILLQDQVKLSGKVDSILHGGYSAERFVQCFTIDEIRARHPGLFYEAVHHGLLKEESPAEVDPQLVELIGDTMLTWTRPGDVPPSEVLAE